MKIILGLLKPKNIIVEFMLLSAPKSKIYLYSSKTSRKEKIKELFLLFEKSLIFLLLKLKQI